MPEPVGKPDWFAQATSLGQAGKDQTAAAASNQDDNTVASFKAEKLPQLQQLLDKLKAMTPGMSNATANTTGAPNMGQVNKEDIFKTLIREFREQVLGEAIDPKAQEIINQIGILTKDMGDFASDDQEITKAIGDATVAIKDFETQSNQYTADMDKELDSASAQADQLAAQGAATKPAAQATGQTDPADGANAGAATKPAAGGSYTIKPGDTLGKIAKDNGTTVDAIMKANPQIKDANKIAAGATLNLTGKPDQSDAETARLAAAGNPAQTDPADGAAAGAATKPDAERRAAVSNIVMPPEAKDGLSLIHI